jgi:hypothetical protein
MPWSGGDKPRPYILFGRRNTIPDFVDGVQPIIFTGFGGAS